MSTLQCFFQRVLTMDFSGMLLLVLTVMFWEITMEKKQNTYQFDGISPGPRQITLCFAFPPYFHILHSMTKVC